ncbi:unnamed protein product [Ascophyllum nodosum]
MTSLQEPTWSGERARFLERFPRSFGALNGWMLSGVSASQLKTTTTMDLSTTFFLFLHYVTFEKCVFC